MTSIESSIPHANIMASTYQYSESIELSSISQKGLSNKKQTSGRDQTLVILRLFGVKMESIHPHCTE